MSKTPTDYTLTLNEEHRKVLQDALDMYSRVLMGQWEIVAEKLQETQQLEAKKAHLLRDNLDAAKQQLLGFGNGASHGIHNPNVKDEARVAYDLVQVLRHEAWKRQEHPSRMSVDSYEPHQSSREVPLAEIE